MLSVSIDIGSTWTKGAVFDVVSDEHIELKNYAQVPTTIDHLADGFFVVLNKILDVSDARPLLEAGKVNIRYSSSAKGGLAVAAMGLVPTITLESAKVTAHSAGAKVSQHFAYKLNRADIHKLEQAPPDIFLFTGGTDGGDTTYGLQNAKILAESTLNCSIIYAGNRDIQDDIAEILSHKELTIVNNILPTLNSPNPLDARKAICDIFLKKIVKGKGLDVIVNQTGVEPHPTPYSVFELVKQISNISGWEEFVLMDMGGATTDIYSSCNNNLLPDTILHGIPEPKVKRTVEGDLGMRVSAVIAGEAGRAIAETHFLDHPEQLDCFYRYLSYVNEYPEYLPQTEEERSFDHLLAGICIALAAERHAGTKQQVTTCAGTVDLQLGRDLTQARKIIGTGGWLSRKADFAIQQYIKYHKFDNKGRRILLPDEFKYYRDSQGLFPLLANVAGLYPKAAAQTSVRILTR